MSRLFFLLGAVFSGLAVAAGAFGAHGLSGLLSPAALDTYDTAVRYQIYHGLGLMAVAWGVGQWASHRRALAIGGWSFVIGILLFSFSLYALALTGIRWLGAITPFGGVAFLLGWAILAYVALKGAPG